MKNPQAESRAWMWGGAGFESAEGVPVTDRGFRYGMSVFESFPVRGGAGIFLERHLQRLREACRMTGMVAPAGALERCGEVLKEVGDGFARIYITAGDGTVTDGCDGCRVFVMVEPRQEMPAEVYERGYKLGLHGGDYLPAFGGLKTGNYWGNLNAFREGLAEHYDQVLLFSPAGHLISSSMANVFVVRDGILSTPSHGIGARVGVVREWVMQRTEVKERVMTRAEVEHADEVFLTSSWLGIMPAASVNGRALAERKISAGLLEAYRSDVNGQRQ
jgi:branched-subunit amino acid aminotransferase/4-amino-4-deoxychorismate lyase